MVTHRHKKSRQSKVWYFVGLSIIFLFASVCSAHKITLAWSPNSEPDLAGYRVFYRAEGANYNYTAPAWEGTETTCEILDLGDGTYYFVARAFDVEELESGNSNEVFATLGLGEFVGNITVTDSGGSGSFNGVVFLGYSGRTVNFDWIDVSGADGYEVRLKHLQKGVYMAHGSVVNSDVTLVIPQTGLFMFEVRAGSSGEWTDWYSDGQSLLSGWPAPPSGGGIE